MSALDVFNGQTLFRHWPDHSGLKHGQLDDLKFGGLIASPWRESTMLKRRFTLPFFFVNRAEWRAFRDFFGERQRFAGFWMPVFMNDYRAVTLTPGVTVFDIPSVGLAGRFVLNKQHGFCAIVSSTDIQPHAITGVTTVGANERITVRDPMRTFDVNSSMVCALLWARLDDDLQFDCLTDQAIRCSVTFEEQSGETESAATGTSAGYFVQWTRPAYLYEIKRGAFTWRLTNWTEAICDNEGNMWSVDAIDHGQIKSGSDLIGEGMDVTVKTDDPTHPFRYWKDRTANERVTLSIFKINIPSRSQPEAAFPPVIDREDPVYVGRLGNAEYQPGGSIRVRADSLLEIGEEQCPKMVVQRTCNHRLFDQNCGVNELTFTTGGSISAVSDTYVESLAFGLQVSTVADPDWFALGKVMVGGEVRQIVGASGNRLYIDQPFRLAAVGQSITATAGCNKRIVTCDDKFDNLLRTVQFPYIPNSNPQFEALKLPKESGGKKG